MPSLLELQRSFGAALLDPLPPAQPRMAAYRANVNGNWCGALAGAYPIVRKIVGSEFFNGMAREYARKYPSASGDLNEYGASMAEFAAAFAHTQDLPYLPDVARMEWLAHRAYYAADGRASNLKPMLALSETEIADLRLSLAPACSLLVSQWPLARIWDVHQEEFAGEATIDWSADLDRILVYRPRWRAQVCALSLGDYRFLESAQAGATLGAALEWAAEDPAFDSTAVPARWVQAGVITL